MIEQRHTASTWFLGLMLVWGVSALLMTNYLNSIPTWVPLVFSIISLIGAVSIKLIHKQAEAYTGLLTFITVVVAAYGIFAASSDAETQRFNTAWLLVNSPSPTSCEAPKNNENEIIGGGKEKALSYLKEHANEHVKEHGVSLAGADMSQAILSFAKLDNVDLNRATMCTTDLFGSNLRASSLWGGHMRNANLQFAQLQGTDLEYADLACADMRGAHLEDLRQHGRGDLGTGGRTNLRGAKLNHAHLEGADLRNADLVGASLRNAHLGHYIDYFNADKDGGCWRYGDGLIGLSRLSSKTDPELNEFCEWFRNHNHVAIRPTFCNAARSDDKSKLHLSDSQLVTGADLSGADLTGADLSGADLTGADLSGADLTGAILTGATVAREKIDAAGILCHTILPSSISDAQTLGRRSCPTRTRPWLEDQNSEPARDRDELATSDSAARDAGPHEYICQKYSDEPWYGRFVLWRRTLSRARHKKHCMEYTDFALEHDAIKTRCVERAIVQLPSNDPLGEYIDCLDAHSHAIEVQTKVNMLSDFINEAGAEVVKVMELERNPMQFRGKTIAFAGFWDKVVSDNEALFSGFGQDGHRIIQDGHRIIIENAQVYGMQRGACILIGTTTGMKIVVSKPPRCSVDDELIYKVAGPDAE